MKEIDRIDKLERDTRRFYYPNKLNKIPVPPDSNNGNTEQIVGKPVADMGLDDGDILIYDKRNSQWKVYAGGNSVFVSATEPVHKRVNDIWIQI